MNVKKVLPLVFLSLCIAACSKDDGEAAGGDVKAGKDSQKAEVAFLNGRIHTIDKDNSIARAMAVSNGKIVAVGSNAEIAKLVGDNTKVFNLNKRMVMPGIHDMHMHPMQAGMKYNFHCAFPFTFTMDEIVAKIGECAASTPKGEWIIGGQWEMGLMESDTVPNKKILDAITTDHPIYLGDSTVHGAWVNSKAMEILGINGDSPDPDGGVIIRESGSSEPTGVLIDKAAYNVLKKLPAYSEEEYASALAWSMAEIHKVGVTAIKDAAVDTDTLKAYRTLDNEKRLNMSVSTSLAWKMDWTLTHEQEKENIKQRASYATSNVGTDFIKIMLDGIPPTRTAGMLEPYVPDKVHGDKFLGKLIHTPETLLEDVVHLDSQDLTIKIHATGDRAVRVALDAVEAARKANPGSSMMHEISHAELIHPDDIPRFRELNVIAELCPILWYPGPLVQVMSQVIGEERANRFWPIRDLHEAGAHLIYGSDWPSVVPDPNPWPGIEAMVSRRDPYGVHEGTLWVEQAMELEEVLRIFTINGARAGKHDKRTGSLEVGKQADFIVLDRNIFSIPVEEIGDTKVLSTYVAGKAVHSVE